MSSQEPQNLPRVSICTPTFNRRPFIPLLIECILHQTYPQHLIEWIILDDGTDPIHDLLGDRFDGTGIDLHYFHESKRLMLGEKRNRMHNHCSGEIIINFDDDDYYPATRIAHAVETLQSNPSCEIAGCSELIIYFGQPRYEMYRWASPSASQITAASFAYRRDFLSNHRYESSRAVAEERFFLNNYTVKVAQLEPLQTIMVIAHEHNSVDKAETMMIDRSDVSNPYVFMSQFTLKDFVPNPVLRSLYNNELREQIACYPEGLPLHKPDMLHQMREQQKKREASLIGSYIPLVEFQALEKKYGEAVQMVERQNALIANLRGRILRLESIP